MIESQSSGRALRVDNLIEIDVEGSDLLEGGRIVLLYAEFVLAAVVLAMFEGVHQEIVDLSGQVVGVLAADVQLGVV